MRKSSGIVISAVLLLQVLLAGCTAVAHDLPRETPSGGNSLPAAETETAAPEVDEEAEREAVASVVEHFGRQLQLVSLLAPEDTVRRSIQEHYGEWVAPKLLEAWLADPSKAPGRLVSSPWPDRIEIGEIAAASEGAYEVTGQIVEITGVKDEIAAKRRIALRVGKQDDRWAIEDVTLGDYESDEVAYTNTDYGFTLTLPESWEGYTIVTDRWEGRAVDGAQAGETVESGPIVIVRHPAWTEEEPRQDIPIMVLTIEQWKAMEAGKFHIGAAPIGPTELGRNNEYVLALPARYNFAFPAGYEEVEEILAGEPLEAFPVNP